MSSSSIATKSKRKSKKGAGKAKRALKAREPKLVENTKKMLLLRGTKASLEIQECLRDLVRL